MKGEDKSQAEENIKLSQLSDSEGDELSKLGILSPENAVQVFNRPGFASQHKAIKKRVVHVVHTLIEAYSYFLTPSLINPFLLKNGLE